MKNLKSVFSLILLVLSGFVYPSVSKAQRSFSYGIKAGANLSGSSYIRYFSDTKYLKTGFQVGIMGEYAFTKAFFLQSELAFTSKGVIYKGAELWIGGSNPPVTHWKNTISQMYVQVPLKVAYKFGIGSKAKLFANAGAYAAYGIGAKDKIRNRYTGVERPSDETSHNPFKTNVLDRFDTGATAGFGTEFGSVVIGINYELGIKDIGNKLYNSTNDFEYQNRTISFTIGYKL